MPLAPGTQPAVPAIVRSWESEIIRRSAVERTPRGDMSSKSDREILDKIIDGLSTALTPGALDIGEAERLISPEQMRPRVGYLLSRGARFWDIRLGNAADSLPPGDPRREKIASLRSNVVGKDAPQLERMKALIAALEKSSDANPIEAAGFIATLEKSRPVDLAALSEEDIARWRRRYRAAADAGKLPAHTLWRIESSLDNGFNATFEAYRLRHHIRPESKESPCKVLDQMASSEAIVVVEEFMARFGENPLRAIADRFGAEEAERAVKRLYGAHVFELTKLVLAAEEAGRKSDWEEARSKMVNAVMHFSVIEGWRRTSRQSEEECFSAVANVYEALSGRPRAQAHALKELADNEAIKSLEMNGTKASALINNIARILDGRRNRPGSREAASWNLSNFESPDWRKL